MKVFTDGGITTLKTSDYDAQCNSSVNGELVISPTKGITNQEMEIIALYGAKKSLIKANIIFIKFKNIKKRGKNK